MKTEKWKIWKDNRHYRKDGKCYQGCLWEVSDQGNIKKDGILYECRLCNGYKVLSSHWTVHRVVAELFVPNPNNYNEVDHINGDPLDNRAINLQWCSHQQNCNNPITRKRRSEAMKGKYKGKILGPRSEESKRKQSETLKNRHRVYHGDGTYHYEKTILL